MKANGTVEEFTGLTKHNMNHTTSATIRPINLLVATFSIFGMAAPSIKADTPPQPGPEDHWKWYAKSSTPSPTNGVNGANRRVSIAQHGAVKGTFSEPNWAPLDHPTNKPTFYLGVSGGDTQSDCGVQWEPAIKARAIDAGWVLFQRITVTYSGQGQWGYYLNTERVAKGQLASTRLSLQPESDGKLKIFMNSSGGAGTQDLPSTSTRWPRTNSGAINTSAMTARRVVGITQAEGGVLTGGTSIRFSDYYAENFNFIGGQVAQVSSSDTGVLTLGAFDDWPQNSSLNSQNLLPDTRKNSSAPWIIDFQSPSTPRDKKTGAYNTGYANEKVAFDLRSKAGLGGRKTRSAK